ncbi:MAG: endonuclease/exonuclease/phosphatase family protein [Chloroflexi bacterium]|nr:endonuclease/exonuclease/phosphatase family protein [Chloroflexota bacterium]
MTSDIDRRLPPDLLRDVESLRALMDIVVPPKRVDRNLLIGTWNLKAFGGLTAKWAAAETDSPKRDLHALRLIAEVVSRFDVVAIQEVLANLTAIRALLRVLGPNWGLIVTDVTRGSAGNNERLGFVFDRRRVNPSGLAAEIVLPPGLDEGAFDRQFARTPYAVSFDANGTDFTLVTLHVLYGARPADRLPELHAISQWLADWARSPHAWNTNFIALGDFNIDRVGDPLYEAFVSTGLQVPTELMEAPRSIFGGGKYYDQIAWFMESTSRTSRADDALPERRLRRLPGSRLPGHAQRSAAVAHLRPLPAVGGIRVLRPSL